MCGVAAIISPFEISMKEIENMTNVIKYRGPDDEGFVGFDSLSNVYVRGGNDTPVNIYKHEASFLPNQKIEYSDNKFQILLAHRRLSIIDLSAYGHQPMCDVTGRYWIVFNGEIYNYQELKTELSAKGIKFQTETDTEVIIESYKMWGVSCQNRFNGMWSIVLYDSKEKTIFLSRDRFGIKPLYYWVSPEKQFLVASEIKQFTVHPSWKPILNRSAAYDYLFYSMTDHNESTLFDGVFRILPGHYYLGKIEDIISMEKENIAPMKWFNYKANRFDGSFTDAIREFRSYFKSAIKLHMRADVEVATALSGGLDSSSIVCEVNNVLKNDKDALQQKTFSSCSEDKRYDEKIWIDEVVAATGVDAHFVFPDGKDIFKLTDTIVWHMDEPYQSQSAFLGYNVFEMAKSKNIKVLLNGQGADEYLSGYTEFRSLRTMRMLYKGHFRKFSQETRNKPIGSLFKFVFSNIFYNLGLSKLVYFLPISIFRGDIKNIINTKILGSNFKHPHSKVSYRKNSTQEITEHQLSIEPLQKYLRWEDRNSMAHSIEARVPFLDYRLVEFCRSLPIEYLDDYDESKKILIHALKDILPSKIVGRKDKKGFITPEERWFTQDFVKEFDTMFRDNVRYSQGIINQEKAQEYFNNVRLKKIPFDYTYWRIILFCIWMKVFKVQLQRESTV